jgi:hypothetical protein
MTLARTKMNKEPGSRAHLAWKHQQIKHFLHGLFLAQYHYVIQHNQGGLAMECVKCSGLMSLERFSDFFLVFYAWKCLNCGAVIDRTIANNRRKSLTKCLKPEVVSA